MKSKQAKRATQTALKDLQVGQVWKVGEVNLAVTEVGKHLVHYRRYQKQSKGNQTKLISKPDMEKYLMDNNAILATE